MTLSDLLIAVAVFALVAYVLFWMLNYLHAPEPIIKVAVVVIVLIGVIWILRNFLPGTTVGTHKLW